MTKKKCDDSCKDLHGDIISVRMVAINEKGEEMGIKKPTTKQILEFGASEVVYHVIDKSGKITELGRAKIDKQKNDVTFKSK
jgi:hypothetical protein